MCSDWCFRSDVQIPCRICKDSRVETDTAGPREAVLLYVSMEIWCLMKWMETEIPIYWYNFYFFYKKIKLHIKLYKEEIKQ